MNDLFDFKPRLQHYAVMGNPINHSKSPLIHSLFASQTDQTIQYDAIHVDLGGFTQAVRNFQAHQGRGLNITVPFKLEAFQLADELSTRAQTAGAVNTLILRDDQSIAGDNTDGFGLVLDLTANLNWQLKNKNILLLGAGGASRGVLQPLLEQAPETIFIANRTASKAKQLAEDFTRFGAVAGGGFNDIPHQAIDLIINATAASLSGEVPPLPESFITAQTACYDMMYAASDTAFISWAKQQGAVNTADGLGMLVGQAAESFRIWRGVTPEITPVIARIRASMT